MEIKINILRPEHIVDFKKDMMDAFQQGAIDGFGEMKEQILPESHIDNSLNANGAIAYEALLDDELVGGAIVVIDQESQHNHLDFLYVKNGAHSNGIGQSIWNAIEKLHPETIIWETMTPYFEKRNIHFYVNKCGFHITEFYNRFHRDPNDVDDVIDNDENDYFDGMFKFEKKMK